MSQSDYASEQLRVIRSLMERATVYRSISAPTALIGGLLSFGGYAVAYYAKHEARHALSPVQFLIVWLVILALTAGANLVFLWRGSMRRSEPFFSPGMKWAAWSLSPAFLAALVLTLMVHRPIHLALVWITLYGLALLATQHFAPRSLTVLGAAFFLTGCILLPTWKFLLMASSHGEPSALVISGLMAATFGGYHLVYAVTVWALGEDRGEAISPVQTHV